MRTGTQQQVGIYTLDGFKNKAMNLTRKFTTNEYRGAAWTWHLILERRNLKKTITVGVAD